MVIETATVSRVQVTWNHCGNHLFYNQQHFVLLYSLTKLAQTVVMTLKPRVVRVGGDNVRDLHMNTCILSYSTNQALLYIFLTNSLYIFSVQSCFS